VFKSHGYEKTFRIKASSEITTSKKSSEKFLRYEVICDEKSPLITPLITPIISCYLMILNRLSTRLAISPNKINSP
jgi:hypothetical protein